MDLGGRKTRGRQKIKMKKIEDVNNRLISFSKRRAGIYKKACELATLCGAQIGIVIFSPTGKPFSFGQPTIGAVIERYLKGTMSEPLPNVDNLLASILEDNERKKVEELSQTLDKALTQLEAEKNRGKSLVQWIEHAQAQKTNKREIRWWEAKIDELQPQELDQTSASLEQFYDRLMNHVKRHQQGTILSQNNHDNMVGCSYVSPFNVRSVDADFGVLDNVMWEFLENW